MTFENLAKLTQAKLQNEPFVSSFDKIVFDPSRIKRGDLFVGNDTDAIKEAIRRDAYAILSDRNVPVLDEEIAWLRCKSIPHALTALLRYMTMERQLHFFYFDGVTATLMQKIAARDRLIFLEQDIQNNFQKIIKAPDDALIIGSDMQFLQNIHPGYTLFVPAAPVHLSPYRATLFLTSFRYHKHQYENLKIPQLFIPKLETALAFLNQYRIAYDLHKTDFTPAFYPLFVNKNLQLKPFGSTRNVLIVSEGREYIQPVSDYLQQHASWADVVMLAPADVTTQLQIPAIVSQRLTEIEQLKEIEFNFAIINKSLQAVLQQLQQLKSPAQVSLFEE